jgi:serine protease
VGSPWKAVRPAALVFILSTLACHPGTPPPLTSPPTVHLSSDERAVTRAARPAGPGYRSGEVIVKFREGTSSATAQAAIEQSGGRAARYSRYASHMLVTLDAGTTVPEALGQLRAMPGVAYAEPNRVARALGGEVKTLADELNPNDTFFIHQWHMRQVGAARTWGIQKGSAGVVVAVLDTGIAFEDWGPFRKAPDWGDTVFVPGRNFVSGPNLTPGDTHANDDNFHGTHVASTIGEATNNSLGVAGLAFGCALMPVKVLAADGAGSFFDVAEGVYYAFREAPQRAHVINLSLGGDDDDETLSAAIDEAVDAGVVVVAASGNDGEGRVLFPARHPRVIGVGALDQRKARTFYSNFGPQLDLMAPGGNLDRDDDADGKPDGVLQQTFDPFTAETEGRYDDFAYFFVDGTSQASPHVAAAAALLVSQGITGPGAPAAIKALLERTAEDLGPAGRDDSYGHGLIRPAEALTGMGLTR